MLFRIVDAHDLAALGSNTYAATFMTMFTGHTLQGFMAIFLPDLKQQRCVRVEPS